LFEDININDNIFAITRSRLPWLIIGTIGGIIGAQIIGPPPANDLQLHHNLGHRNIY